MYLKMAIMLGTVLALVLGLVAIEAANSDSGAGWLHFGMIWASGFITSVVIRWTITD